MANYPETSFFHEVARELPPDHYARVLFAEEFYEEDRTAAPPPPADDASFPVGQLMLEAVQNGAAPHEAMRAGFLLAGKRWSEAVIVLGPVEAEPVTDQPMPESTPAAPAEIQAIPAQISETGTITLADLPTP